MADGWSKKWLERFERREKDEDIHRAINTGDCRTALMELFKDVRQVDICKHGNMTTYRQCPQCERDLDQMMNGPVTENE